MEVHKTESSLRVHMKARFTCLSCRKQLRFPSECRSHIKKFHSEENTGMESVCNKCGIAPTHFEDFTNHAESEHKMPGKGRRGQRVSKAPLESSEPDRFCRYCDLSSKSMSSAKVHLDLIHTRANYSCQVCVLSSKRKLDVARHIQADHTCGQPTKLSVGRGQGEVLKLHLADHTETSLGKEEVEEAARLEDMATQYLSRLQYQYVVIVWDDFQPNWHKCTMCGKSGKDRGNLRKHVENIHFPGTFNYHCKYSFENFSTRNSLNIHISKDCKQK